MMRLRRPYQAMYQTTVVEGDGYCPAAEFLDLGMLLQSSPYSGHPTSIELSRISLSVHRQCRGKRTALNPVSFHTRGTGTARIALLVTTSVPSVAI